MYGKKVAVFIMHMKMSATEISSSSHHHGTNIEWLLSPFFIPNLKLPSEITCYAADCPFKFG